MVGRKSFMSHYHIIITLDCASLKDDSVIKQRLSTIPTRNLWATTTQVTTSPYTSHVISNTPPQPNNSNHSKQTREHHTHPPDHIMMSLVGISWGVAGLPDFSLSHNSFKPKGKTSVKVLDTTLSHLPHSLVKKPLIWTLSNVMFEQGCHSTLLHHLAPLLDFGWFQAAKGLRHRVRYYRP